VFQLRSIRFVSQVFRGRVCLCAEPASLADQKDKGRVALYSFKQPGPPPSSTERWAFAPGHLVTQPSRLPDVIAFAGTSEDELVDDFKQLRRRARTDES
jgi:hypothetical protein